MQGAEVSAAISETRGGETRRTVDDLVRVTRRMVGNKIVDTCNGGGRHRPLQRSWCGWGAMDPRAREPLLNEQQNDLRHTSI